MPVVASGYWATFESTVNKSIGAVASRSMFVRAHHARLRTDGPLFGARLHHGVTTGLTAVYIKVWRRRAGGTTFDLIGTSNNLVSTITPSVLNTLYFSSPILGCKMGDYLEVRLEGSADGTNQLVLTANTNAEILEVTGANPTGNFDWLAQSASSGLLKVQGLQANAAVAWLGYSNLGGANDNTTFCTETTLATDASTTSLTSTIPYYFHQITGLSYQNVSIGGNMIAQLLARLAADALSANPDIVVIHAGGNDVLAGTALSTFSTQVASILDMCQAHGCEVLVLGVLPGTFYTNAQSELRDQYNAAMSALVTAHSGNNKFVNLDTVVGQFRAGGTIGNLWDIRTELNVDGLHITSKGNRLIGQHLAKHVGYSIPNPSPSRVTITRT